MDYQLSESQELMCRSTREFLATECPASRIRDAEKTESGFDLALWRQAVDLGWPSLGFASAVGGSDGLLEDVVLLAEELGRGVAPLPFLPVVIAGYVLDGIGGAAATDLLKRAFGGSALPVLAVCEEDGSLSAGSVQLAAVQTANGWGLTGQKLFVEGAGAADTFLVVARTGPNTQDVSLFAVDRSAAGLRIELDETTAGDKLGALFFENVAPEALLGDRDGAWPAVERALNLGLVVQAGQTLGMAQQALDLAVEYSKNRIQFGRPIGSFQALQHKMADRSVEIDSLRYLTYRAAWLFDRGEAFTEAALKARGYAGEICGKVATDCAHMFGGYGMVLESDVQLYYRRLRVAEVRLGDSHETLERLAVAIGL